MLRSRFRRSKSGRASDTSHYTPQHRRDWTRWIRQTLEHASTQKRGILVKQFQRNDNGNGSAILLTFSSVLLRFALGVSLLSAVADRFGLWGAFGMPHVAWGTFARFVAYTGQLNWFLPKAMIPAMAVLSTFAETIVAILLLLGWQTRIAAVLSGVLLLSFAVTMTGALGIKAPLDASVFSAAGGSFLLAGIKEYPFSIDRFRKNPS